MTFQIHALPLESFTALFDADEAGLQAAKAKRVTATHTPGFPCRVSLQDAQPGEALILVNFQHQPAASPFQASHAVYVRQDAVQARPAPGEVPALLRSRTLSLRGFDEAGLMVAADLVDGTQVEALIAALFADPRVVEIHIHSAKPGCFVASATRA